MTLLSFNKTLPPQGMHIGSVHLTKRGRAITLRWKQQSYPIDWHADLLPNLETGDHVLFNATEKGLVLVARLQAGTVQACTSSNAQRSVTLACGQSALSLAEHGQLQLSNAHCRITLSPQGHLRFHSRRFSLTCRGLCRFKGSAIYLN